MKTNKNKSMNKDVKAGLTFICYVKVYNEQRVVEQFKAQVPQTPEDLFNCSHSSLIQWIDKNHEYMCSISDENGNEIYRVSKMDLCGSEEVNLYGKLLVNDLAQECNFTHPVMTQSIFSKITSRVINS